MKREVVLLAVLATGVVAHGGIFDDEPEDGASPGASGISGAESVRAVEAKLNFVPNATKQVLLDKLQAAVATVQKAADAAASAGDTGRYDALTPTLADLSTLLDKTKGEPFLPSLYPLAIAKRGCLCALSERTGKLGPADAPLAVTIPQITWFSVRVTEVQADGAIRAEVYDTAGKVLLYSVVLKGMESPSLTPGKQVKLVNVAFECTGEEQGDSRKIYYLKRIAAAAIAQK